jgi:hypothetical protein
VEAQSRLTTPLTDERIYSIADKHGTRYRTADEEGMSFDKHAVLDFANDLASEVRASVVPQPAIDALHHALDWIAGAPHGDNCFVSKHYEGDPGDQCNCGKDSVTEAIEAVLAAAPQCPQPQANMLQVVGQICHVSTCELCKRTGVCARASATPQPQAEPSPELERDARRYRWLRDPGNVAGPNLVASYGPDELDAAIDAAMKA